MNVIFTAPRPLKSVLPRGIELKRRSFSLMGSSTGWPTQTAANARIERLAPMLLTEQTARINAEYLEYT